MADLSITAANVISASDATRESGTAGETITAGKAVYKAASGLWMLADNDSATALARKARGIALTGSSNGQPIVVHRDGVITIGATLTAGAAYYLSATAGGICPAADLATGQTVFVVGHAISTTQIDVAFRATGVTK